jgi:hypothetical protein
LNQLFDYLPMVGNATRFRPAQNGTYRFGPKTEVAIMPRLSNALPKYRKHRASGQAIVTFEGRDFYLGPHGTQASKIEYDRLIGEWLANRRRIPVESNVPPISILELCEHYLRFCLTYYVKNGKPTDELASVKTAIRHINKSSGETAAREFGPLALSADESGPMVALAWKKSLLRIVNPPDAELQGFFAEATKLMASDAEVDKTTAVAEPADGDEDNANEKL